MKDKQFFSIILICFFLGMMISVQMKSNEDNLKASTQYQRLEQLSDILLRTEQERDVLKNQLSSMKSSENIANMPKEVELLSGMTAVKGPGIELTIEDSKKIISSKEDGNLYIIHDEDMLKVINELKAAGAEAISINNQRLIATSEIRCAGPTVSVNNTRLAAPFIIKAIGNPTTLENAINMRGGVAESLSVWGIQVSVRQAAHLVIPGYEGVAQFKYSEPVAP